MIHNMYKNKSSKILKNFFNTPQESKRNRNEKQNKHTENNAVTDLSPDTSIIILNISSLNSVIKRQKLP